ncbi:hypothetical protein DAEQUDRAFT_749855 [Daedalea quercina L-15889]|uniref:SET domain-containing protein n=1 Tax=Daedalea quercina L-15889 TaxID=1314783 RepID=A0A165S3H3_9APHY|nr:hypothetical protein DAEQUDRAFT_749855 [Daedalea quercina L-15889]
MDPQLLTRMMAQMGITPAELAGIMSQFDPSALSSGPAAMQDFLRGVPAFSESGAVAPRNGPPPLSFMSTPEDIKNYKAWFENDSKKPPVPGPTVPRELLVADQERLRREQEEESLEEGYMQTRFTVIGFPKHSCKRQLHQLKPINCSDMLMRKTHLGSYLLCRSIAPCTKVVAIQTVVEDVNGDVRTLSIYNFPTAYEALLDYVDLLFPIGVTMAILEPTYKAATQGPNAIIRVDSPTDIVFLDPRDEVLHGARWKSGSRVYRFNAWPSDADHWKARGNDYFKAVHWLPAVFAYSHGLRCEPESLVLRLNRSEGYLRLKFYSAACADAHHVRCAAGVAEAHRGKALFREAKAEYGRERYQTAKTLFEQWWSSHPKDTDVVDWITRCNQRLQECSTGTYDWTQLFKQSQTGPYLDIAGYTGPIEVKQMPNRGGGRGVAATRDIQTGDLLLVAKPFSFASAAELQSSVLQMTMNMLTSRMDRRTQSANVACAVAKIYGNPDLHDHVFHLYAGPDYPPPPSTHPPCPDSDSPVELDPLQPSHRIDIARLESICTHNCFGVMSLRPGGFKSQGSEAFGDSDDTPIGLYPLASLFNHSCAPNSSYTFIGNIMVVRAVRAMKLGEEVTLSYMPSDLPYFQRRETLERGWHMTDECDCRLCIDDRADGEDNLRRREEIAAASHKQLYSKPLSELRSLERKLSATYATTRGPHRPALFSIHQSIAENLLASCTESRALQAIQENIKALECLGWTIKDSKTGSRTSHRSQVRKGPELAVDPSRLGSSPKEVIGPMLRIAQIYVFCHDMTNAKKWLKTAQWVFNATVGGGNDLFMLVERPTLERFELLDTVSQIL